MSGRFDGKAVVITGGSGGIGKATAARIVREGGRVLVVKLFWNFNKEGFYAILVGIKMSWSSSSFYRVAY